MAAAAVLAVLVLGAAPGFATNNIKAGAGGTSIIVNGKTISTSNVTLAQLAKLQGVPQSAVSLELDGVAAGTPAAPAVEAFVASLPAESTVANALAGLSTASGGAITPATALQQVLQSAGQPGVGGANGSNGGSGAPGANGSGAGNAPSNGPFSLRVASRSLNGHPRSRVVVRYSVSAAAKLTYGGGKLAGGSRKVGSGNGALMVKLPAKHGTYQLKLTAVSAADGKRAQVTVTLHDTLVKAVKKGHH
jgi:hypothetical protein